MFATTPNTQKTSDQINWLSMTRRPMPTVPTPPTLRKVAPPPQRPRKTAREEVASSWRRIRFATSGSMRKIQDWLETHCEGRWHIGVTGFDRDQATKFGEVHFENFSDKQRFKAFFATQQMVPAPLAA
jgi:hypothetical protein